MRDDRTLIVMRHAKAAEIGASDGARQLTDRGTADATEAGSWLTDRAVVPDQALVSPATRTEQTWRAMADGAGWDLEATFEAALYDTGTETVLDLVRRTPDHVRVLLVLGHNPTMASLAQLVDDGEGDEEAGLDMTLGFPTSALAVFGYAGDWADLDEGSASVVAFHVGRS